MKKTQSSISAGADDLVAALLVIARQEGGQPVIAPGDFDTPDWANAGRVHDWKNYISDPLRAMWTTFTSEQKAAIASNADELAGRENWD